MGLIWILHSLRYARRTGKQNREKLNSVILDKLNYSQIMLPCPNINPIKHDHQAGVSQIPLGASVLIYLASDHCFNKHLWHTLLSFGCAEVWNENQKKNYLPKIQQTSNGHVRDAAVTWFWRAPTCSTRSVTQLCRDSECNYIKHSNNTLKNQIKGNYLETQSVPRSKHTPSRLYKPIS